MNIAISQLNFKVADFEINTKKIIHQIDLAKEQDNQLIIFPELAIGGNPAFDLLKSSSFLASVQSSIQSIVAKCSEIACIIGIPYLDTETDNLFNAILFIQSGSIKNIIKKKELRNKGEITETPYFSSGNGEQIIECNGCKIMIIHGDDLSLLDNPNDTELIISLNNKAFSYLEYENKLNRIQLLSKEFQLPIIEVNQVGAQGQFIFDGRSILVNSNGVYLDELNAFKEDLRSYQLVDKKLNAIQEVQSNTSYSEIELIHKALVFGIRDYFEKNGFSKAILGLSGGMDSALVATLACEALGAENVLGVLMPSMYSTDHSIKDAEDLVKNLGCKSEIIPIKEGFDIFNKMLEPIFQGAPEDVTEQNIQARVRAVILMAISNKQGFIVLNTSNKSEAAMGYGTLYGDLVGSLSVLGDVYKTQVFEIARYINRDIEIIPEHTIIKPPSAELSPGQKDSDSLPIYEILDPILFQLIEKGLSVKEVVNAGFAEDEVNRIVKMMSKVGFKLFQTPPALHVSLRAFGTGLKLPLVAKFS